MSELQLPDIDGSDYSRLLAGHLGHLTPSQEKSLETFKQHLQKADLYTPKADDGGRPSHDDTTLLSVRDPSSFSVLIFFSHPQLIQPVPSCAEVRRREGPEAVCEYRQLAGRA